MTLARFKLLTIMPSPDVDMVEALEAGFLQAKLNTVSNWIEAQLAKRYAVPFGTQGATPSDPRTEVPDIIEGWIVAIVTPAAYAKKGYNPSSGDAWFTSAVLKPHDDA